MRQETKAQGAVAPNSEAPGKRAGPPQHQLVYARLREMILFGEMTPGQPVTIQGLVQALGAGMTPVREALRRLTAEGALEFRDNRRIVVPELDAAALEQLALARAALEPELARRAASRVKPQDIKALEEIDTALDAAISASDTHGYLRGNYQFHQRLYRSADAPILADMVDGLWLRFGPSLRGVLASLGPRSGPDMHKALLDALRAKEGEQAAAAVRADLAQGLGRLARGLTRDPAGDTEGD